MSQGRKIGYFIIMLDVKLVIIEGENVNMYVFIMMILMITKKIKNY